MADRGSVGGGAGRRAAPARAGRSLLEARNGSLILFAAALLAALTYLVADLTGGSGVRLGTLLVIPPLVASLGCNRDQTAIVALLALALAVGSGSWNDTFGSFNYYGLCLAIAIAGGLSVRVAVLRERLELQSARALLLADSGNLLADTLDQAATAEAIGHLAVPELCDAVSVDLVDPDRELIRSVAIVGANEDYAERIRAIRETHRIDIRGEHPAARVARTGASVQIPDFGDAIMRSLAPEGERYMKALTAAAPRSSLTVPMRARGRTVGALTLVWFREAGFDGEDIEVAEELGRRAAHALYNARRHEGQAHIANVLQRSLQPDELPQIAGIELGAVYLPVGEQNEVGGDFYELIEIGDRSLVAVIGDVSGKGAEAAAVTAIARNTLQAEPLGELAPAEALRTLNRILVTRLGDGRFCTVAYARLDRNPAGGGRLQIALGGHPNPLILRRGGAVEEIGRPGTLLGAFIDPALTDATTALEPGDALVMFTDGVFETRDELPGGARGESSQVAADLAGMAGQSPSRIAARLGELALARQRNRPRDDIAILVIRV